MTSGMRCRGNEGRARSQWLHLSPKADCSFVSLARMPCSVSCIVSVQPDPNHLFFPSSDEGKKILRRHKTVAFFELPLQQTVTHDGTGGRERQGDRTQAEVEEEDRTRTFCLPRAVACARQRVRSPAEGQTGAKRRMPEKAGGSEDSCEGPACEKGSVRQVCPREPALFCGRFDSTRSVPWRAGRRLKGRRGQCASG